MTARDAVEARDIAWPSIQRGFTHPPLVTGEKRADKTGRMDAARVSLDVL
jgi:hypothetical protein